MAAGFWTDETKAHLRRCIDNGLSARAAGILMGCSHNMLIGMAGRLGWRFNSQDRPPPKRKPKKPKQKPLSLRGAPDLVSQFETSSGSRRNEAERRARYTDITVDLGKRPATPTSGPVFTFSPKAKRTRPIDYVPTPWDVLAPVEQPTDSSVPIWELRVGQCRATLGDPRDAETLRYCGKPVVKEGSWCKEHHARYCRTVSQAAAERRVEKDMRKIGRWS